MCTKLTRIASVRTSITRAHTFLFGGRGWLFSSALAGAAVVGMFVGGALATHGDCHGHCAIDKPAAILNNFTLPGGAKPLVVFAVYEDGAVQPYYYNMRNGKPGNTEPWEDIPDGNDVHPAEVEAKVTNPKTCWNTSGGDRQCVVY